MEMVHFNTQVALEIKKYIHDIMYINTMYVSDILDLNSLIAHLDEKLNRKSKSHHGFQCKQQISSEPSNQMMLLSGQ